MKKFTLFCMALSVFSVLFSAEITVDPANAQIVLPAGCGGISEFAAKDLQHNLKLITGKTIPTEWEAKREAKSSLPGRSAGLKYQ